MNPIGKPERATQNRVVALFRNALGYRYLGDWSDRANRHIEEGLLRDWLARRGHTSEQVSRALDLLGREANNPTRSLYDNNHAVYSLLRYGTVGTPEKMFLAWKEDKADNSGYKLDKYLLMLCDKTRLIELMHDLVLFDGGIKKLPRMHQYFGIKAAQRHARDYRGGIIWHTQGSGKSIVMVLSALDAADGGASPEVLLQDRLTAGRERLEAAREAMALLCEPVPPPKGEPEHIHYFCGSSEIAEDLTAHEPQRIALYKSVAALVRAYASIADNLPEAGYSAADIAAIEREQTRAVELRETIRKASGETLDLKAYEADMRHLIDTYIKAEEARRISAFGEIGLLALIVQSGIAAAIASLPKAIQGNRAAIAEVIANNVRSKIIREHLHDPAFYDSMSRLLAEVLADLKAQRIDYETYLKRIAAVVGQVQAGKADDTPEPLKASPGLRAIYNLLLLASGASTLAAEPASTFSGSSADSAWSAAQAIDAKLRTRAPDGWRDVRPKEQEVKRLVYEVVQDTALVERLFPVIKAQTEY